MNCCCCFCSECTGTAQQNTSLCSACLTGSCELSGIGFLTGTNPGACTGQDLTACLPFAGVDANNNDIYQKSCGALVYSDGTTATRDDISCNCGACKGTVCMPCSPKSCGASTPSPAAKGCGGSPKGGGSGAGSAPASGSKGSANTANCATAKLSQALNKFGATMATLMGGGTTVSAQSVVPGQKVPAKQSPISTNMYLLIIVIFGFMLFFLAFGKRKTGA